MNSLEGGPIEGVETEAPKYGSAEQKVVEQPDLSENNRESVINSKEYPYIAACLEYVTGISPEDPRFIEQFRQDYFQIRGKYGLPNPLAKYDQPTEYERFLREMAIGVGAEIGTTSECGTFFQEVSSAGGVYLHDRNYIGVDIERGSLNEYVRSISRLEHEVIHALQNANTPSMPVERKEYEAYMANLNVPKLADNPADILSVMNICMGGSIRVYYRWREEETRGVEKDPWSSLEPANEISKPIEDPN